MRGDDPTLAAAALERVARAFETPDGPLRVTRLGSGHIHDTFLAEVDAGAQPRRYVLQRLHTGVFADPEAVMRNVERVTAHLAAKLARAAVPDRERRCLALVAARDGRAFHRDGEGGFWRCFRFVEGSLAVDGAPTREQAFEAARAFGAFAAALADLPGPPLSEVIPHFHDLPHRMAALEAVLREDPLGRARAVAAEAAAARAGQARLAARLAAAGAADLPRRTVHNDCKVNNVLLDARTGEALCVIDLDTVMEGTLLADFGDLARTAACPAPEDERDLERVRFDLLRFEALARGYLAGTGALLAPAELRALPLAGPLLALENAVRFLADHVAGDRYFRIHRPGHNLDRARAQLRLAEGMLAAESAAAGLLAGIAASATA
jgi:Ser/Thr protein kinase RdoA (MazF antagonist)